MSKVEGRGPNDRPPTFPPSLRPSCNFFSLMPSRVNSVHTLIFSVNESQMKTAPLYRDVYIYGNNRFGNFEPQHVFIGKECTMIYQCKCFMK